MLANELNEPTLSKDLSRLRLGGKLESQDLLLTSLKFHPSFIVHFKAVLLRMSFTGPYEGLDSIFTIFPGLSA